VLPSGDGETWGLVINESLNFGLPLIISDMVGSARDLCTEKNGLIFKYNNLDDLCRCMKFFIREPVKRRLMSQASRELVKMYTPENTALGILDAIYSP
jgi:glycosyltransferase involved in cell wall biosynthesis